MQPTQEAMECPRCDRKGLVQRNSDVYKCVYCGFRRDLSSSAENVDSIVLWMIGLIIVIFVMVGIDKDHERTRMRSYSQILYRIATLDRFLLDNSRLLS